MAQVKKMKDQVDQAFTNSNPVVGLLIAVVGLFLVKKFPALAGILALVIAGVLAWWALNGGIDFSAFNLEGLR